MSEGAAPRWAGHPPRAATLSRFAAAYALAALVLGTLTGVVDAATGANSDLVFLIVAPFLALDAAARRFAEAGRRAGPVEAWRMAAEMAGIAFAIDLLILLGVGLPLAALFGALEALWRALLAQPPGILIAGAVGEAMVVALVFRAVFPWRVRRHLRRRR